MFIISQSNCSLLPNKQPSSLNSEFPIITDRSTDYYSAVYEVAFRISLQTAFDLLMLSYCQNVNTKSIVCPEFENYC